MFTFSPSVNSCEIVIMLSSQVRYKAFDEIEEEKKWWKVPFVSEFLRKHGFESALKKVVGSESVQARQFVEYAFGQLKSFSDAYLSKDGVSNKDTTYTKGIEKSENLMLQSDTSSWVVGIPDRDLNSKVLNDGKQLEENNSDIDRMCKDNAPEPAVEVGEKMQSNQQFWKNFASLMNQNVIPKLGLPTLEKLKWDGFDLLNQFGLQSKKIAEAGYIESGLATPEGMDGNPDKPMDSLSSNLVHSSIPDIKKATQDLLRQTDSVLGALMVLTAAVSKENNEAHRLEKNQAKSGDASNVNNDCLVFSSGKKLSSSEDGSTFDVEKAEEMKQLFSTAESAMEAWAMLATSLGHPSFIKSEFEKICFLDSPSTDTQVIFCLQIRDFFKVRLANRTFVHMIFFFEKIYEQIQFKILQLTMIYYN